MTTVTDFASEHLALLDSVPVRDGAHIVETTVPYQHDGVELEGYLAYDASLEGPLPAVVIVHDWFGISDTTRARAQMFARLGYAAFAVDVYGAGIRPSSHDDAQQQAGRFYADMELLRARVAAGFDATAALDVVDADRIAALGYCFGGTPTLELARTGAPAKGFASFRGGLVTHDGEGADRIAGPVLVMTGAADPVVPDEAVIAFENELRSRDDLDWQVVSYAGAPHAFTVPGPNYREKADKRSWREIEGFLAEVLA